MERNWTSLRVQLCRNEFAFFGMVAAFAIALEIEAILLPFLAPRSWSAQLTRDAMSHGMLLASCMAPAVWAAWAPTRIASRLATALLGTTWMFILWQFAMQVNGWRVVGVGYAGNVLTCFGWMLAVLLLMRWKLGVAFDCHCSEGLQPRRPWQLRIWHLMLWMAIIGGTLAAGRFAFLPEPADFAPSLLQHALRLETQVELALTCARVLPIAVALAFKWRWLPMAVVMTATVLAITLLFDYWRAGVPFTRVVNSLSYSTLRFDTCNLLQVLPPLFALRLLGCRLVSDRNQPSPPAPAKA